MKKIVFTAFFGLLIIKGNAQSDMDALRYSNTPTLGTTARSIGLGGAIGALGADVSAVLVNPAGLAQFKTSQLSVSFGTHTSRNTAKYAGSGDKTSFTFNGDIPNVSVVFSDRRIQRENPAKNGWVNSSFMLSYNRTADFNRKLSYQSTSPVNSLTDYVSAYSRGLNATELDANDEQLAQGFYFFENMFWYTFLIDSVRNRNYTSTYDKVNGIASQKGNIATRGGSGEFNIAYAANYEHKVYFGGSVNIHNVTFTETNKFTEGNEAEMIGGWDSYSFTRNLETSGYGFSGRLGVILRPNNNLRFGATLQTPTRLVLSDEYSDGLFVTRSDGTTDDLRTIDKEFSYEVVTPARFSLQGAYIFGKKGLITAELESIDYSTMNLSTDNDDFEEINFGIVDRYKPATNVKVGAEYVMNSFRLRSGFASVGNPLVEGGRKSRKIVSAGFGMHEKTWAFDFAFSRELQTDEYLPYQINGVTSPSVKSSFRSSRLMLTLSTKF